MLKQNYFRPEPPLSVDRPKIILFHAWFHHKIILAELRPWVEFTERSVAQAPTGARKFPPYICCDGLLPPGDYSRQMLRLAGTTAS